MVGKLLVRGMLAGVVAGMLTFGFARWYGEPQVAQAVSLEGHAEAHAAMHAAQSAHAEEPAAEHGHTHEESAAPHGHAHEEEELVSRTTQAGIGLLTGVVVFGAAIGGLFSLVFAYAYGRVGALGAKALSAWLALAAFITLAVVPMLKYPANPPSVGMAETIGFRTGLFFLLIAISVTATVFALKMRGVLAARLDAWNASIGAAAIYIAIIVTVLNILPPLNEVSTDFPAVLLWQFRLSAIGMQLLMWTTIGLLFGWLVERAQRNSRHAI